MKILIAEDEPDIAMPYRIVLEKRNHQVMITDNGEACLEAYYDAQRRTPKPDGTPFDAVVLDYRMPKKDGMEVAKEILAINPHQRIIFASAYVKDTLVDSVKQLKQVVELMQKPFELDALVDTVEDKEIYAGLEKLNVKVQQIKDLDPTHEQVRDLVDGLSKIMKNRTF
ncbi:MAG: DNA-binding response OmpR family regulator [Candidatus Nitrosomirales archaeon]|jgi:DNA-binding response OmpR family regulator